MDYPTISVVIPTYNRGESLCSTISSVLAQAYPGKTEVIVADQSPGHSEEVAAFFHQHQKDLRYLRLTEANLPRARNVGLAEAGGELVLFVDDDIVLPPDALSRLASRFQTRGSRALSGLVLNERDPESSLKGYAQQYGPQVSSPNPVLIEVRRFIGALMFIPAESVRRVGGFDEQLGRLTPTASGEDYDFCYRLRESGVRLFIDPSVRVTHRDDLAGGCEVRKIDPELAVRYQMRSSAYMSIKHHGRIGWRGWAKILRGYVLNSPVLKALNRFSLAGQAVAEAEDFARENPRQ
jgi:GT2 family glycosyltransferase